MLKRREFVRGSGLVLATSAFTPFAVRAFAQAAAPPPNFSSNRNYFIWGGGQPIVGLVVTVDVTEDMVAPAAMSMQLNCSGMATDDCDYQQYVTNFDPTVSPTLMVQASMENWPSKAFRWHLHESIGLSCGSSPNPTEATCGHGSDLFNKHWDVGRSSGPGDRLPAGYKIQYELLSDPASGAITAATYSLIDNRGGKQSTGPHHIEKYKYSGTNTTLGPQAMAPIYAVQMNLVGKNGGRHTQLTSGAGTIVYEARTPLAPQGTRPASLNSSQTAESSNVVYGELNLAASNKIVQTFALATAAVHTGSSGTHKVYDQPPPSRNP
jgi:hypothetical protein